MCARCFISFFGKGVNLCTYTVRANALVPPTPIFAAEAGAQSPWIRSGSLPKVETHSMQRESLPRPRQNLGRAAATHRGPEGLNGAARERFQCLTLPAPGGLQKQVAAR